MRSRRMISMFLRAIAACTGWPPKVIPCEYICPLPRNGSITRSLATIAPIEAYAEDSPLADVIRSGVTPKRSDANHAPTRPNPVITSSKQSRIPYRSQISRTPSR